MLSSLHSDFSTICTVFINFQIHDLNCDHEFVRCAEIVCPVDSLNSNELGQVEVKSLIAHGSLQEHFSGWFSITQKFK